MPAVNGGRPQVHRYSVTPIAHRSTIRASKALAVPPETSSGEKKAGVPTTFGPLPSSRLLAKQLVPKSAILSTSPSLCTVPSPAASSSPTGAPQRKRRASSDAAASGADASPALTEVEKPEEAAATELEARTEDEVAADDGAGALGGGPSSFAAGDPLLEALEAGGPRRGSGGSSSAASASAAGGGGGDARGSSAAVPRIVELTRTQDTAPRDAESAELVRLLLHVIRQVCAHVHASDLEVRTWARACAALHADENATAVCSATLCRAVDVPAARDALRLSLSGTLRECSRRGFAVVPFE